MSQEKKHLQPDIDLDAQALLALRRGPRDAAWS
jgi:hypothetical protein